MSTAAKTAYVGAYLVRGGEPALAALTAALRRDKVYEAGSPDAFVRSYRKFGVDEADDLRMRARTKPVMGGQRVFALHVPSMTTEAQNALLKTLEEPTADAVFFIVSPSPEMLLPTVRSRMQTLDVAHEGVAELLVDPDAFLKADRAKRIEMLKPLYDHDEDEGRDIGAVIGFLQGIEERFARAPRGTARDEGLRALYRARKYAGDKGSLLKALLEQFALLAPRL